MDYIVILFSFFFVLFFYYVCFSQIIGYHAATRGVSYILIFV
jgi:hypothetical protein